MPQNLCSPCIKQLLACNTFRDVCVSSSSYLEQILQLSQEPATIAEYDNVIVGANHTDIELIQSEIEAETYIISEHHDENGEIIHYYYDEPKLELDHDYYIEANDNKSIGVDDIKTYTDNGVDVDDDDDGSIAVNECITYQTIEIQSQETVTSSTNERKSKPVRLRNNRKNACDPANSSESIEIGNVLVTEITDAVEVTEIIDANINPNDPSRDLCIICGAMQSHGNLRRHMETHMGDKRKQPFSCPHCDRKFINRPSFVAHVNKHSGVKPFACTKCDKKFYGANLLRTHMYSHSTENKYACQDCDKVFRYPHYLSQHRRIHRANTVYSCEYCEYTNVYLHNYKNHMRKHTGQYRFKCELCLKGFSRKLLYTKHMARHTIREQNLVQIKTES